MIKLTICYIYSEKTAYFGGEKFKFITNAIDMNGGMVSYEATQHGNNFYFIIPKSN